MLRNVCVYTCITYTGPLSVQAQYSRSCPIISSSCHNSSLVKSSHLNGHASVVLLITNLHRPSRKHRFQQYPYSCMRIRCRGNVFTKPLPRNDSTRYSTFMNTQAIEDWSGTVQLPCSKLTYQSFGLVCDPSLSFSSRIAWEHNTNSTNPLMTETETVSETSDTSSTLTSVLWILWQLPLISFWRSIEAVSGSDW
jgi:hypothetical protein